MIEYEFEYIRNNAEALHDELAAAFDERYISMDSSDDGLIIRFTDEQRGDKTAIQAVLDAHDPTRRTQRQEKVDDKPNARKRLLALDIETMRGQVGRDNDALLLAIVNALEDLQKLLEEN